MPPGSDFQARICSAQEKAACACGESFAAGFSGVARVIFCGDFSSSGIRRINSERIRISGIP